MATLEELERKAEELEKRLVELKLSGLESRLSEKSKPKSKGYGSLQIILKIIAVVGFLVVIIPMILAVVGLIDKDTPPFLIFMGAGIVLLAFIIDNIL